MKRIFLAIIVLAAGAALVWAAGLTIPSGSILSVNNNILVVTGEVVNNGTIEVTTGIIQLTGDWTNNGTFTAGTGTVEFVGSAQAIRGKTTFYHLLDAQAGAELSFEAGNTQEVTGRFTLTGSGGNLLKVRSTVAGLQAQINPSGPRSVSYVDVKDSKNLSSEVINPANSVDSGNNVNWFPVLTPPIVTVESPAGGEKWQGQSAHNIIFTATSEPGIKDNSLSIWYSTDGGATYPNVITADAAVVYSYPWTTPPTNTNQARVRVSVKNNSDVLGTGESAANFIIDNVGPDLPNLVTPANGSVTNDNLPTLTWEAATDSMTAVVSYEIHLDTTTATQGAVLSFAPSTPLAEGLHTWEVRAKDEVGNWGAYRGGSEFTFEVDTVGPNTTGIVLRDRITFSQTYTNDRVISLEAQNVTGSPTAMAISCSQDFSGATWENYFITTTFELTAGEGAKTVYYQLSDAGGNRSSTVEAAITYDATPPSVPNLITPANGSTISESTPNLTWEAATDNLSGIASYEINLDGNVSTRDAAVVYTPEALAESPHTWEVKARDGAWNWGAYSLPSTFEVVATTTTTTTTTTSTTSTSTTTTSTTTTTMISQVSAPSVITAKQGAALNLPIKFASLNAGTYRLAIYCIDPPGPVVKDQLLTVVPGENIFNTVLDPNTPAGLYYISLTDLSTGTVQGVYVNIMSRF